MKRTQLQLEEELYQRLRQEAFQEGISLSELVRRILRRHVGLAERAGVVPSLGFVAMAESDQGRLAPVSERHDEALWED